MGTRDTRLDILGGVGKRVGHGENCEEMPMTSDFCQKILEDDQQAIFLASEPDPR